MARPRRYRQLMTSVSLRADSDQWSDLAAIYGTRGRAEAIRLLIESHLDGTPAPKLTAAQRADLARARRERNAARSADDRAASEPAISPAPNHPHG